MYKFAISFLLIISISIPVIGQFTDDFSDNDFSDNPAWSGDDLDFDIDASRLHLNAPSETSISVLSTASGAIEDASWEFTVTLNFNPTANNLSRIYLVSSSDSLSSDLQGYFVSIGNSSKEVSLYRQDDNSITEIIDGINDYVNADNVIIRVRVTRSAEGQWQLLTDLQEGAGMEIQGSILDTTYFSTSFFGVYCKYTSTRSDKFYFSDFIVEGQAWVDTETPSVVSYELLNDHQIQLVFSEPMDMATLGELTNFSADNGLGNPTEIEEVSTHEIILNFSTMFSIGETHTLTIINLQDLAGNMLSTSIVFAYFETTEAAYGDVIINEIMADPTPEVGLPAVEYIEIYNSTDFVFDLQDWQLVNSTTAKNLSGSLLPDTYLILCDSDDQQALSIYGATLGIPSFTALANSGDSLTLVAADNAVIDVVSYEDDWYHNSLFSDGGYSLERVNPYLRCSGEMNWMASSGSLGGTPGTENSVFSAEPDLIAPQLVEVLVNSNSDIILVFDEQLLPEDVEQAVVEISNGVVIDEVYLTNPHAILVSFTMPLMGGVLYSVSVTELQDCAGNIIDSVGALTFGLPVEIQVGDIVINEVLADPFANGNDFVELYNNTDKFLKLQGSKISRVIDGVIVGYEVVTGLNRILHPHQYLVLTEDKNNLIELYPNAVEKNIMEVDNLPAFNNEEGTVIVMNPLNQVVDSVHYLEAYHFGLLVETEGVSLERLDFDGDSNNPSNWHSASESSGFATPGFVNSQSFQLDPLAQSISIDPKTVSPDNDGYQDVIAIRYQFDEPGYVGSVRIYNDKGQQVRELMSSALLGVEGVVFWDGLLDSGNQPPIGIYIVYLEFFNREGTVLRSKELVTVAAKL